MTSEEFESIKTCLKNEIELLRQNNKSLETRIEEMKINLVKMENLNSNLKTEVQKSKDLNERLLTIDNSSQRLESEASLELIKNLEELMKVNQALKDRNDELEINILNANTPLHDHQPTKQQGVVELEEKCAKRKVDYQNAGSPNMSPKTKWSKKTECSVDSVDEDDECDDEVLAVSALDVSTGSMELELDHVKMEIMKMISEKKQVKADKGNEDNEKVKKVQDRVNQLELENKKLKQTIQELHHSIKIEPGDLKNHRIVAMPDIVVEQIGCIDSIDRSSPDGQEKEEEVLNTKEDIVMMDARIEQLQQANNDLDNTNSKLLEEKKYASHIFGINNLNSFLFQAP